MELGRSRITWVAVVAIAVASVAVMGCGGSDSDRVSSSGSGSGTSGGDVATVVPAVGPPVPPPMSNASTDGGERLMPVGRDSLPPEVEASAIDGPVARGSVVEITAEGSPDVTGVTLWDGIGKRQAMTFDGATNRWTSHYRVPLKPSSERIGLSVTATNHTHRWRRVWVFLQVESTTSDSTIAEGDDC